MTSRMKDELSRTRNVNADTMCVVGCQRRLVIRSSKGVASAYVSESRKISPAALTGSRGQAQVGRLGSRRAEIYRLLRLPSVIQPPPPALDTFLSNH